MTIEEFVGKIEWEGGITEALDYGLRADHLDDHSSELFRAWKDLERIWHDEVKSAVQAVEALLPDTAR